MHGGSRILLISNSTVHACGYLDHVQPEIEQFLASAGTILFFPFALHDHDGYAARAKQRFDAMGFSLKSAHQTNDIEKALAETDAIFIGGGNTFRLLKALQDLHWLEPIREKVRVGAPYIGSSAGSNVAAPTIKTTNDMPIVQPRSFDALDLVPFQINPHYRDADPGSTHMGETHEERILQFLEDNMTPVVGIREGAWLLSERGRVTVKGRNGVRIFRRGCSPVEAATGSEISELVGDASA